MKKRIVFALAGLFLLNSCIVKSLQPFYTQQAVSFDSRLIGKWTSYNGKTWEIKSTKELMNKEREEDSIISIEDEFLYKHYKDAYFIEYTSNEKYASFIGVPFKIDNQLFIDFMPVEYNQKNANSLASKHLIETHSLTKVDRQANGTFKLSWFDEDRMQHLFDEQKIRLKHERPSIDKSKFVLTETSENLMKFLKKYMSSEIQEKWKTNTHYTLTKVDARP